MRRARLLALQILVAVMAVGLWHVLTVVPIFGTVVLPPFFFSTPADVGARVLKWFADGSIWHHLWVTLDEAMLAFAFGSIAGVLVGFWFALFIVFFNVYQGVKEVSHTV
jgi:NitT/TauT family transport system permease protein